MTNEAFTLSGWFQSRSLFGVNFLMEQAEGLDRAWSLRRLPTDPGLLLFNEGIEEADDSLRIEAPEGSWIHFAVTRTADGHLAMFRDGAPTGTAYSPPSAHRAAGRISIGCNLAGDRQWRGRMSDVMMHDRALSPDEIKVLASNRVERPLRPTRCRDRAAGIALPRHTGIVPDVWVEDHFLHRRYTSDDGLPGNEVRCVLQANDGHVWVGTKAGFARFDGSRFLVFTPENTPGLRRTSADVRSICEGQDGTIWIGTFGGLLRVDGSGVNVVTNGLPELFILRVEPGPDGTLWVACLHNGDRSRGPCWVVRYDPKSQRVLSRTRASNQVYELRWTEAGLWMVTESEGLLWDGKAELPEQWLRPGDITRAVHLGSSRVAAGTREWVASLAAPRIGPFLEITGSGFPGSLSWSVDRTRLPRTGRRFGPPTGEWQGTRDGLFQKTSSGWRRVVMGTERMPQEIYCLTPNREGGVWYGTGNEDGLHLLIPREARPYSLAQGMPDAEVNSMATSPDGSVVAGTWAGYARIREERVTGMGGNLRGEACVALSDTAVLGLCTSTRPTPLMLVTESGSWPVYFPLAHQLERSMGLMQDRRGGVWMFSGRGIVRFEPPAVRDLTAESPGSHQKSLAIPADQVKFHRPGEVGIADLDYLGGFEARDGTVWIGTKRGGVFLYSNGRFAPFKANPSLEGTELVPRLEDPEGRVWIVSTEGLYCWDHERLVRFTTADGLRENLVLDLARDPAGNFWAPGALGVHRITGASVAQRLAGGSAPLEVMTVGAREGMTSPQCARQGWPRTAMTDEGVLWVPTGNGAVSIDTRHVRPDRSAPPVVITEVLTAAGPLRPTVAREGQSPNPGDAISAGVGWWTRGSSFEVPPEGIRAVQFRFATLAYGHREDRPMRYRLRGHDAEWSEPGPVRVASYTSLRPGDYTFEVQAANRFGQWTEVAGQCHVRIRPHLYERGWFRALILLGAVGLAAAGVAWRLRVERRLARLREERRLAAERARIARDMHDELGAGLTQLSLVQGSTRDTGARARQLLRVLDEIVWTINPRKDSLEATVSYLASWAQEFLEDFQISLELDMPLSPEEISVTSEWRHDLLLCAKEALNNVARHSGAGKVVLSLRLEAGHVLLSITDDGRGMPSQPPRATPAQQEATA